MKALRDLIAAAKIVKPHCTLFTPEMWHLGKMIRAAEAELARMEKAKVFKGRFSSCVMQFAPKGQHRSICPDYKGKRVKIIIMEVE
jgi:hypothetical protein